MNARLLLRRLVAVGLCVALAGCLWRDKKPERLALPELPRGEIELRVVHLVNPRLPQMDAEQIRVLLDSAKTTAKAHLGLDITFSAVHERPLAEVFATIPPRLRADQRRAIYDFKSGRGDPEQLIKSFATAFAQQSETLAERVAFARVHLPGLPAQPNEAEFSRAIAQHQLRLLERWRKMPALDGGPAIDTDDHNEFMIWLVLGQAELPYELVLTNQVIASVEHAAPAVHSALRGGYTNGLTNRGRQSRLGTFSVWSTFAFTGNEPALVEWRDGERYERLEAARLAGMTAVHELGHQLLHLSHPLLRPECVMYPVPRMAYRAWAQRQDAARCPVGSDPAMTPGAHAFHR